MKRRSSFFFEDFDDVEVKTSLRCDESVLLGVIRIMRSRFEAMILTLTKTTSFGDCFAEMRRLRCKRILYEEPTRNEVMKNSGGFFVID